MVSQLLYNNAWLKCAIAGLYFDLADDLRYASTDLQSCINKTYISSSVNYARLWLSLISPSSEKTEKERRKYARLVGNIDTEELYMVFQSASALARF